MFRTYLNRFSKRRPLPLKWHSFTPSFLRIPSSTYGITWYLAVTKTRFDPADKKIHHENNHILSAQVPLNIVAEKKSARSRLITLLFRSVDDKAWLVAIVVNFCVESPFVPFELVKINLFCGSESENKVWWKYNKSQRFVVRWKILLLSYCIV